ncbi:MAG: 30S ribosomal protein S4 [Patescibacteria group bacterium]
MARFTGSKEKMSRKVGRNLFPKGGRSFSAKAASNRRPYKPGAHGKAGGPPAKMSEFGKQLLEKQLIKSVYGLLEKQFYRVFQKALKKKGDTAQNLLTLLESRLDNVILKAGFADSRAQARQLVNHGHFLLNDQPVNVPSLLVKPGDKVTLKPSKKKSKFWAEFSLSVPLEKPTWLDIDADKKSVTVVTLPLTEDLPTTFRPDLVVEFYSR